MSKFKLTEIKGVIPAMLTFFDEKENVDEKVTREMTEFMINAGVNGFYLTGSTGSCYTMTAEERNRVVDTVIDQTAGRVPVIVHIGDIGTKKSIALAEHAAAAGADAISSVPPFYWGFSSNEIYNYYKDISSAVDIPMVVYNVVSAGIMDKALLSRLAELPNVKGIKYTARSHDELGSIKRKFGKDFMIYSGCDEMAFSGLAFGADGIIGSYYNIIPELYLKIYAAFKAGDIKTGMHLQTMADEFIFEALEHGDIPEMHLLMKWRGLNAGFSRRPFLLRGEEEISALKAGIARIKKEFNTSEFDIFGV